MKCKNVEGILRGRLETLQKSQMSQGVLLHHWSVKSRYPCRYSKFINGVFFTKALHTPGRSSRIFSRTPVNEINVLKSCIFLKHFVLRISFRDLLLPFMWLSMLSGHISLDLPRSVFPFIFTFITNLSADSSSLVMTRPNHRRLFLVIT